MKKKILKKHYLITFILLSKRGVCFSSRPVQVIGKDLDYVKLFREVLKQASNNNKIRYEYISVINNDRITEKQYKDLCKFYKYEN